VIKMDKAQRLKQLTQEMKANKKLQTTTSPDVIRADLIRKLIYKRADYIAGGLNLVGVQTYPGLDVKYQFPSAITLDYPVAEGARGDRKKIDWTTFYMTMDKGEGSFMITDEAQMRQLGNVQYQTGVRRLAEALAMKKDDNIIDALCTGAAGNSVAAAESWPTAVATSIAGDVAGAIGAILAATGVQPAEIKQMGLVLPYRAWASLLKVVEIENIRHQMEKYIQSSWGISIHPTKNSTVVDGKYGLALIKGADTGIHGVAASHPKVPLVEIKRETGVGLEYTVRQFFNTRVIPDSSTVATSTRLCKITGVIA